MDINSIILCGKVKNLKFSHTVNYMDYYKFDVETERESGRKDEALVVFPEGITEIKEGDNVFVSGSIRSRRIGSKLQIYVFPDLIKKKERGNYNEAIIEGHVCSIPYHKQTIKGELTQFLVCIENGRDYYISSIIWDDVELSPGDKIVIKGHLQSRIYWSDKSPETVFELVSNQADLTDNLTDKIQKKH